MECSSCADIADFATLMRKACDIMMDTSCKYTDKEVDTVVAMIRFKLWRVENKLYGGE